MGKIILLSIFLLLSGCCSSTKRDVSMYIQGYTDGWQKGKDYTLDSLKKAQGEK